MDPDGGDYRVAPGSPAEGYGCQTFRRVDDPPGGTDLSPAACQRTRWRDEIEVSGSIGVDTLWAADTVRVVGDVTVEDGVTLRIAPGVRVEFQDYYSLRVAGSLLAVGRPDAWIVFTTDEPEDFVVDSSLVGCWNGIRFEGTRATNAPSYLAYCVIEYSKAAGTGTGLHPYGGGAVSVMDFSALTIENCVIRNNVAGYGGALFLYCNANVRVMGNLITHNHALGNGGAIYCAYSYPRIFNNTLVRNRIHNEDDPYAETGAIVNFLAKPLLLSNILRDNSPDIVFDHAQIRNGKAYYTHFNNIEGYTPLDDNIDADPLFVDPRGPDGDPDTWQDNDYHLLAGSPCIDAGEPDPQLAPRTDVDGQKRVWDGDGDAAARVDMGSDEFASHRYGDLNCDGDLDGFDIQPFVLALTDPAAYGAAHPGCDPLLADCNGDGVVDGFDIQPFVALLTEG